MNGVIVHSVYVQKVQCWHSGGDSGAALKIVLSNSSSEPIYAQIGRQVKGQIMAGTLAVGTPLPSIRGLAKDLQISVITTKRAYEELAREGFIDSVGGKGTFVAAQNEAFLREKRRKLVEEKLIEVVTNARALGVSAEEIQETVRRLWEKG